MKSFDVVVGRQNGHFLAAVVAYPHIAEIGTTVEEAVSKAKSAVEDFLTSLQVVTVTVDVPEVSGYATANEQREAVQRELENVAALNNPAYPPGSPKALLKAIAACRIDPNDQTYQQYVAAMEAEEQRQWEEFERENPAVV